MSKIKLDVAWTCDDGPQAETKNMLHVFKTTSNNPIPVTWFIQYDYLKNKSKEGFYKDLQDKHGHEVGIHGVSVITNHVHWFPSDTHKFISTQDAVTAIHNFKKYLTNHGIRTKFARAPTGLYSELMSYFAKLNITGSKADVATRNIIKGNVSNYPKNTPMGKVAADFQTLKNGLKAEGLHLWGGTITDSISAQSWERESAGRGTGRHDSLTEAWMKNTLYKNGIKHHSLVLLCHDTKAADVTEVKNDIQMMEKFAQNSGIEIQYHTMSDLFKIVTGNAP